MKTAILMFLAISAKADSLQDMINNSEYVPHGTYAITQPLTITSGVYVNFNGSTILQQCAQGIVVNTYQKVTLENLVLYVTVPEGIGITVEGNNGESVFHNVDVVNAWVGYNFLAAAEWHVQACRVAEFTNVGIFVSNPANPDAGDSEISGCIIASSQHPIAGIFQTSSDGLRVENCKINGGMMYGFALFAGPGALGDLNIVGNSIESQEIGVYVVGTTAMFHKVVVEGNEFLSVSYAVLMPNADQSIITGNTGTSLGYGIVAPWATVGANYVGAAL